MRSVKLKKMPELILKFNLPDEQTEADIATNSTGLYSAIHDFKNELRGKLKHGNYTEEEYAILESISDSFHEMLENNNVLKLF